MTDHQFFSLLIDLVKSQPGITFEQVRDRLKLQKEPLNAFVSHLQGLGLMLAQNDKLDFPQINSIEPLSAELIQAELSSFQVDVLPPMLTLKSTNQHLKTTKSQFAQRNRLCIAEHQSNGRGRQAKTWISPVAQNIILSLHVRLEIPAAEAGGLSLVTGISIIGALSDLGVNGLHIKWPNDVFWQDNKLAGILIESTKLVDGCVELVVGIGVNVRMSAEEAENIDQRWADLAGIMGKPPSRNAIIAKIVSHLLVNYSLYEKNGLNAFLPQWRRMDYLFEKSIVVNSANGSPRSGTAIGINERGELLMRTAGKVVNLVAGDISVRKLS